MEKKRVSVQIEGRSYSLITTDDEKYVQKVANEVLSHIRKAAQSTKQLDTRDCAVLAALNFCDDRNKALKKNKDYVEKADKIIQQTNDLNRLCKEYREKLTEAMNDNTRLINNNKELEKRLAVLGHEVSQLKEKLESVEKSKEKAESEKSEPEKNSVSKGKKTSDAKNNMTEQSDDIPVNILSNEAKKTEQELRNEKLLGYVPMTQFSLFDEDKKQKHQIVQKVQKTQKAQKVKHQNPNLRLRQQQKQNLSCSNLKYSRSGRISRFHESIIMIRMAN